MGIHWMPTEEDIAEVCRIPQTVEVSGDPKPETRNPEPEIFNPGHEFRNPKPTPETRNTEDGTCNPNPAPQTLNRKLYSRGAREWDRDQGQEWGRARRRELPRSNPFNLNPTPQPQT